MRRASVFFLFAAVSFLAFPGCGNIKEPNFPYVASPLAIVHTPAVPAEGDIIITFQLIDREVEPADITLEYSTNGGTTYSTATLTIPGDANNLASAWHPGKTHTVTWNSVTDMVGRSGAVSVCVKITPSDASNPSGTPGISGSFTVNNIAYNEAPAATAATPAGVQTGNIQINYFLADVESNTCSIAVLYSTNDGTTYQAATMGPAGDGVSGLSSSPSGTAHVYLWDSRADNVAPSGQVDTIRIRITPTDFNTGTAGDTNSFSVDNSVANDPPTVAITGGPADGSTVTTTQVAFTWSGSDTDGSVVGYYYSFDHDPPDTWTTATSALSGILSDGDHTFRVVSVDDDNDLSTVASRTFTVSSTSAVEITTTSLPNGVEGQPYNAQLQATGGTLPYTWSCVSGSLAAIGLSLNTGTGEIAGVLGLGTAGSHPYTFRAEDSGGPPQSTQKNLNIVVFAPGADLTRTGGDFDFGPDDGNLKLILDGGTIKLAPEGDEFGSVIDAAHWTQLTPVEFNAGSSGMGEGTSQWQESGGVLYTTDGGTDAWVKVIRREIQYDDADIVLNVSETRAEHKLYVALQRWCLWRDDNNRVSLTYRARSDANWDANLITVAKCIDGTWTKLHEVYYGIHQQVWLRIKRVRGSGTQTFTFYYALADPEAVPGNWVEYWSGEIYDATHFNENHQLYPTLQIYCDTSSDTDFEPELDNFFQWTGDIPAQRFWDDSPECDIIDSNAGTPEYCLDAGAGNTWSLTSFSAFLYEPGTSSVKFRAGWSDSSARATATWINGGSWMTVSELDAQVAAGALDSHRYVFLQAQFNSDSTDQPTLSSISFSGGAGSSYTASAFDISPALDDNNQKIDIEVGVAKLQLWSDEFGSSLDDGWTVGAEYFAENGSVSEAGGVCAVSAVGGGTDGAVRAKAIFSSSLYEDVTVEAGFQNYDFSTADPNADGCVILRLWIDTNNFVHIYMNKSSTSQRIYAVKRVGGTYNTVGEINSTSTDFKFRIVRSGDTFSFHYDDGGGWMQLGSNTTAAIGPNTRVSIQSQIDIGSLGADVNYCRITATDDLYWDDSPEALVVDNAAVEWAFDAGAGYLWQISDASCVKSEPGTSSVKFKIGGSDTGNELDVLWLDTTWLTISEVKARAASGAYDANRYIHVKAQFASGGADQPTLSSFSIFGAKMVP